MKNKIHIRKRYLFLIILSLGLSMGLIFLPEENNAKELPADKLMMELDDNTRFISTDEVADMIINQDPTLLLIDLRKEEAYKKFALEGALNIPLDSLFNKKNKEFFERAEMKKVFYGEKDFCSEQAWILLRRSEYKNMFIMKGGLVEWVETIMQPVKPAIDAPRTDWDLYNQRQSARRYFAGGSIAIKPGAFVEDAGPKKKKKAKVVLKRVVKAAAKEEGC